MVALAAVLVKDRQFWFGTEPTIIDANIVEPAAASQTSAKSATAIAPSSHARVAKKQVAAATISAQSTAADEPVVATNRSVLPPLDVEVVAGDKHRHLHPGSNAAKLEITKSGIPVVTQSAANRAATTNAAERERIADASPAAYPPLAQHMNVQGSVVLQALIGVDGVIQNLRVMSGPAILASAAQQAVREWRFKPILQNGQAVESKATITVNFTIKVADNASNATLAESRPERILHLTR